MGFKFCGIFFENRRVVSLCFFLGENRRLGVVVVSLCGIGNPSGRLSRAAPE